MSDTPETDDIARGNHVVPTKWAQQLERERDEARRKLNNLDVTAIHSCHNECQRPICVLRRERDEAREEANKLSGAYEDATNYYARIIELKEELDEAREAAAKWESSFDAMERAGAEQARRADENREWALKAERERDEAREKVEQQRKEIVRLNGATNHAGGTPLKIALRERDEAREVLKRIAHASMSARHKEEDYAEWEKAVESLQGICEEKNFINE
jgi:chromosome segregation ATPase